MSDYFHRYEDWMLSFATRPSVLSFIVVFAALALVTLAGYRQWTRSLHAFFWFCLVNVAAWTYLSRAADLGAENRDHVRLFLIHAIIPVGAWLVIAMIGRFFFGTEDNGKGRRQ